MQRVLFISGLACGKFTLVSALLRKEVFTSVLMEHRNFLTEIVSGDSERCFAVNKDGNKKLWDLDKLRKMVRMPDDFEILRDMEYILYECPAQANNLTFAIDDIASQYEYDSYGYKMLSFPCWENDAVVYVLNATLPFTQDDLSYIKRYLSVGSNRNLFFCINNMNCIKEEYVSMLKNDVKENLKECFMTNGVFDEALYQNRVFFLDAFPSLNARLGKSLHTRSGAVRDIKDIDTGVPEFEYTLRKFLQQQAIAKQRDMEQRRG